MARNISLDNLICRLRTYFNEKQYICAAYLFGSAAKGKSRQNSDIDLAVVFCDGIDSIRRFNLKLDMSGELEEIFGSKVDIVDLESADLYFVHQILLNKILIHEKDVHKRVEFEVKSRRGYFDMLPFYKLYHSQAMERLERR